MDVQTTLTLIGIGLAAAAAGGVGDQLRKRAPLAWHAHIPWNGLTFGGAALALVAAVHLANLFRAA